VVEKFSSSLCRVVCTQGCWEGISQFQERQRRIGIKELFFALLADIFLKGRRGLWVVSVQAVQDLVNVRRPLLALVEGVSHVEWRVAGDMTFSGSIATVASVVEHWLIEG
jgi:hypothetical protein